MAYKEPSERLMMLLAILVVLALAAYYIPVALDTIKNTLVQTVETGKVKL